MVLKKDLLQFLGFKQLLGTIARWWFPIWENDPIWRALFCSKRVGSATAKTAQNLPLQTVSRRLKFPAVLETFNL